MRIFLTILLLSILWATYAIANSDASQLVKSVGNDLHIFRKHGRYYVIGSQESLDTYLSNGHIQYTRTLLGAGPLGETVVIEFNRNDPTHADRLQKKFEDTDISYVFY